MYTLQLDEEKMFECHLKIQGTSLKKSKVSLVIERDDGMDIKFKGQINENGKVSIPIRKLDSIINEGDSGKLYLEVIADNAYFIPFTSDYITEIVKKVTLESIQAPQIKSLKPIVELVQVEFSPEEHATRLLEILYKNKINVINKKEFPKVINIMAEYVVDNHITDTNQANKVLNSLLEKVAIASKRNGK